MKTSIAIINSSISLKEGNGKNGYNFYQWLKDAKNTYHKDMSLCEFWQKICFANCTEKSCFDKIPV